MSKLPSSGLKIGLCIVRHKCGLPQLQLVAKEVPRLNFSLGGGAVPSLENAVRLSIGRVGEG
jgi:hypothetical protein